MPTTHLRLSVRTSPDVLHRVVSVCRRRALEVESLTYGAGEIALVLVGREDRTRGIIRWLLALIDVLDVVDVSQRSAASRKLR